MTTNPSTSLSYMDTVKEDGEVWVRNQRNAALMLEFGRTTKPLAAYQLMCLSWLATPDELKNARGVWQLIESGFLTLEKPETISDADRQSAREALKHQRLSSLSAVDPDDHRRALPEPVTRTAQTMDVTSNFVAASPQVMEIAHGVRTGLTSAEDAVKRFSEIQNITLQDWKTLANLHNPQLINALLAYTKQNKNMPYYNQVRGILRDAMPVKKN